MSEFFMKLLWNLAGLGKVKNLSLREGSIYSSVLVEVNGKTYDITIREEETEEEKND